MISGVLELSDDGLNLRDVIDKNINHIVIPNTVTVICREAF